MELIYLISWAERKPQKNWPLKGEIEFQNVYVKYGSEEEPFLKNICCTIRPCEKVPQTYLDTKKCIRIELILNCHLSRKSKPY